MDWFKPKMTEEECRELMHCIAVNNLMRRKLGIIDSVYVDNRQFVEEELEDGMIAEFELTYDQLYGFDTPSRCVKRFVGFKLD